MMLRRGSGGRLTGPCVARPPPCLWRSARLGLRPSPEITPWAEGLAAAATGCSSPTMTASSTHPRPYSRRENLTLLGEAGHHRNEQDEALLNWAHWAHQ